MTKTSELHGTGAYLLGISIPNAYRVQIGKLGNFLLKTGYYIYCGNARGPGGLAARLTHHLRPSKSPHWHIDYFKTAGKITDIWTIVTDESLECALSQSFIDHGFTTAIPRFGASDCRCSGHLIQLDSSSQAHLVTQKIIQTMQHQDWKHTKIN